MSWNNTKETRKFIEEQRKNRKEYLKAGLSEAQIRELYEYDKRVFLANRRERDNTCSEAELHDLDIGHGIEGDLSIFENLCSFEEEYDPFVIGFEDERLNKIVRTFKKPKDVAILVLISKGYQKSTIADILGVSCSFVTRHLDSFKKIF